MGCSRLLYTHTKCPPSARERESDTIWSREFKAVQMDTLVYIHELLGLLTLFTNKVFYI